MPEISPNKPYRIGRSKTGLGLFATRKIKKGSKIVRYFGPMLDSRNKKHQNVDNKYLFEISNRWTIDGSVRKNIARYINHACRPNAESDVNKRKRRVIIRAVKTIQPGEEINYDYGTDYFKIFLKPIGCKCDHCEKRRAKKEAEKRADARAEKQRLKLKAEKKAAKDIARAVAKPAKTKAVKTKAATTKSLKTKSLTTKPLKVKSTRTKAATAKTASKLARGKASPHARGGGQPTRTKASRTRPLKSSVAAPGPERASAT
jgi:hypothetical protein